MKYSKFKLSFSAIKYSVLLLLLVFTNCKPKVEKVVAINDTAIETAVDSSISPTYPKPAADRIGIWGRGFVNKTVAVVGNQTSVVQKIKGQDTTYVHLVDTLLSLGVKVKRVFAPEHGFRGTADAGATIKDGIDAKTGIPVISLYGKNKQPKDEHITDVDFVIFDIQDVGARFYTYISTLHYVMQACAANDRKLFVLDRPNPNGHYVDGPILEKEHQSFVGMHPIPVVHGMTIGEYAQMINGEGWLDYKLQCPLSIIKMSDYSHDSKYSIPIAPSPNLPNDKSINLYPSLCFFEGTTVSVGRGTDKQFQIFGAPYYKNDYEFSFTPQSNPGAQYPKHENKTCYGMDLQESKSLSNLDLEYLVTAYAKAPNQSEFFNSFFTKLAGTKKLQEQIQAGLTPEEIRDSWQNDLNAFLKIRKNYLLYP
ncbi:MAG: DUF1343 domain-containing protein [Bacteroidota bacterium]|uniref:exo-beta-N-acetylmuramidase NamZ family protein n=1 Tax=Nonlabens sp. MIC269 TaxID=1476901 RepID=UPI000761238D|nr:DUF1343 domain-containing protein [Nonlabens sp. MIC269]MEE2801513.1 DUF1343 domain-containing protein [Bacteroidota bacterium]